MCASHLTKQWFLFCFVFVAFFEAGSHYVVQASTELAYVVQAGLELKAVFLSQPLEC